MRRIRSHDTKPELLLRSALFKLGMRYRLRSSHLPGKPDIVFSAAKVVVFVHGCFWHRHQNCIQASRPKTNTEYWSKKLASNELRDRANRRALEDAGYDVRTAWECDIEADPAGEAALIAQVVSARRLAHQRVKK